MSQHGYPERLSNTSKGFQEDVSSQTMEVLVETLTGTAFEITVSPSDTIFDIKSKIYRVEGIPVSQQHLVYNLRELEDARSLREQSVCDGAKLRLVLGLRGGPVATRRLPPPESWHDIERLLASKSGECDGGGGGGGGGAGSGCKVTVVVFREGERVNMLRVRENKDGTYSPVDGGKYSSSLSHLVECESDEACGGAGPVGAGAAGAAGAGPVGAGAGPAGAVGAGPVGAEAVAGVVHDNAVTMTKMMQLRHRMHLLTATRPAAAGKRDIQKTRSEETLAAPSLLEGPDAAYDGLYARYEYDGGLPERYAPPPAPAPARPARAARPARPARPDRPDRPARGDSEPSIPDADESTRLKLSDALSGSILVKREKAEERSLREDALARGDIDTQLADSLATIHATEYGPLVVGEASGWRARGFGSSSQLAGGSLAGSLAGGLTGSLAGGLTGSLAGGLTGSLAGGLTGSLAGGLAAGPLGGGGVASRHSARSSPPLSDALFSSSTSDLEHLKRNRILPALSRHRNREHLHLSDERLDRAPRARAPPAQLAPPAQRAPPAQPPAPPPLNREVGSERRQRRIDKITEMEQRCKPDERHERDAPQEVERVPEEKKKAKLRCAFCRKRLSIATVHTCRCGAELCAPHRYAEAHGCAHDHRGAARARLRRDNPPVCAPKLPKI